MGIEVQGMAYAYGCPAVVNGHNELTYTTFYDYKIINRSNSNYHDVFVSMFSDVDLGIMEMIISAVMLQIIMVMFIIQIRLMRVLLELDRKVFKETL
jgi:hypothetical protein